MTATTPDPDDSNNTDTARTSTDVPTAEPPTPPVPPRIDDPPEYPGPFDQEDPADPELPDEVLGLAITGASSLKLASISLLMLTTGLALVLGTRRARLRSRD